ncbi:hypothetical protein I6M56_15105 [Shewanella algae]|uniref:hypothetical protein n=1 Tax=Shewanella algae TaxID=38313 RepID=UPI001AAF79AB|nr:hypothetical protein [Shewanella algae]MBO2680166.1 hypothetical protein [Shewanella algae]
MKASLIEILSMVGTWVSGLGAFSAVFYAINSNKPKITPVMGEFTGRFDDEFTIDLYNLKPITLHILHIRLVKHTTMSFKKEPSNFSQRNILFNKNTEQCKRMNIEISTGEHYQFKFSVDSMLDAYCDFCDIKKPRKMLRMVKADIAFFLSNGSVCYIPLPNSTYQKMKESLLYVDMFALDGLLKLGPSRYFPKDYNDERVGENCKEMLDGYQYSLKRYYYTELPYGIKQ